MKVVLDTLAQPCPTSWRVPVVWWVCPGDLKSFAFSCLEKWDFLCFVWLVGENCLSREPWVSPAAVQQVLWRPVSLLVGHPVERTMLTWVSLARHWEQSGWPGWGSRAYASSMAQRSSGGLSFPIPQSFPLVLPMLLACSPSLPSTSSPVQSTSLSSPTAPGGIVLTPCGLG